MEWFCLSFYILLLLVLLFDRYWLVAYICLIDGIRSRDKG